MVPRQRFGALDRFDRAVILFAVIVIATIGMVVVRGDQIGISVQKFSQKKAAPSQGAIQITFDEPIDLASAEVHFTIDPPAAGTFAVNGGVVTFQPIEPLREGQTYTVTWQSGLGSTTGRALKKAVQWTFTIRQARLVYQGPSDDIAQNLFIVDPAA